MGTGSVGTGSEDGGATWPVGIAASWGLRERPGKGPRPGLTVDRIVDTAVGLAVGEGLAAVSMGRVAKELGVSTMSLYRYVTSKDELLVLMQEAAFGLPPERDEPDLTWREALSDWAFDQRAVLGRHLWILHVPIVGPPATPNSVAWMERGLAALRDTALGPGEKLAVIQLVSGFVRTDTRLMADMGSAMAATGATVAQLMNGYNTLLGELIDSPRFPEVAAVVESGVMAHEDGPDDGFTFQRECLLDGVAQLVRRAERGRGEGEG